MTSPEKLARQIERLRTDVRLLGTQPRLARSSIDGGSLTVRDNNGFDVAYIGEQWDGSYAIASVSGPPLPSPSMPLVLPVPGGLRVYWDGTFVDNSVTRMDFKRVTFHAVTDVDDFDVVNPGQIIGAIETATGGEVSASLPPVEHFVCAVAWTDAGKFSVESDWAFGTPLAIVDQQALDDLETAMAAGDVAAQEYADEQISATQAAIEGSLDPSQGGVIQTSELAQRGIKISSLGLLAYDAAGAVTLTVNAETGSIALKGDLTSGSTISGATVTGGTVQTQPTGTNASAIRLAGNILLAYDQNANPIFSINGNTGAITAAGPIMAGGKLTGAVVQTIDTVARGIKLTNSSLVAYDSSGVQTFSIDGTTGKVEMTGTLKSGSTITGSTLESLNGVTGAKTMISSGLISMYSAVPNEQATGFLQAGSWTLPGPVTAAQTLLTSPRISGSEAAKVRLWQSPNGLSGAELWAGNDARLSLDMNGKVIRAEADFIHLAGNGLVKNSEVKIQTNKFTVDAPNGIMLNGRQLSTVGWNSHLYVDPKETGVGPNRGWFEIYRAGTNVPECSYMTVTVSTAAMLDAGNYQSGEYALQVSIGGANWYEIDHFWWYDNSSSILNNCAAVTLHGAINMPSGSAGQYVDVRVLLTTYAGTKWVGVARSRFHLVGYR